MLGFKKSMALVASASALVWCMWMNWTPRHYHGTQSGIGARLVGTSYAWRPTRTRRLNGWPRNHRDHLGWAESENREVVFLDGMRPREINFYPSNLMVNSVVTVAIGLCVYLLVLSILERQISLRGIMLLIACVAILTTFVYPTISKQIAEQREIEKAEQQIRMMEARRSKGW